VLHTYPIIEVIYMLGCLSILLSADMKVKITDFGTARVNALGEYGV
jgi:hypothetical protein